MKRLIVLLIGACILVVVAGCSQTSQAKTKDSEQPKDKQTTKTNDQQDMNFDLNGTSKDEKKDLDITINTENEQQGITPDKIKIPSINVNTEVIKKGIVKEGEYKGHMATPDNGAQTAWFKKGPKPGEQGASIIAGHVNTLDGPGVFSKLVDLKDDDLVYITGEDGKTLTFKVFDKQTYPTNDVPLRQVFGYTPEHIVRLITCTGDYIQSAGTHNMRLTVSAVLVDEK